MSTRSSVLTERDLGALGQNIRRWRKLVGWTSEIAAERAGITRTTLRAIENGESVRSESLMSVLSALGIAAAVIQSTDPLNSDLGRLNAERMLPQRVSARR
ncbi:helix-turn-helix domain-containing protein [Pseudolysinimonas sp.]|uniref:helix-turn-helix domain-containing protein n=1 Tax=Pseudolysinimonas sp. TaxID=2680009 RepID=UPI003C7255D1